MIEIKSLLKIFRMLRKKHTEFMNKLSKRDRKLYEIFIFMTKFAITAIFLHLIIWMNVDMYPLQVMVARAVGSVMKIIGYTTTVNGDVIYVSSLSVRIIRDCIGWKSFMAIIGLVIATPRASWRNRAVAILIGGAVIFIVNIIRLVTTILIGIKYGVHIMDVMHIHLWRWGLTTIIILYWYVWYTKFVLKTR